MNLVLASFGTDGDVFPYLGLGKCLVERGHTVSFAGSGHYETRARKYGIRFRELIGRAETDSVLGNPDFWHPLKGGPLAAKWGIQFLERQYVLLVEMAAEPGAMLVANPGVLAARLVHDAGRVPFASVVLQPWLVPSLYDPPILPGGLSLPRGSPRWLWRVYFRLLNLVGDVLVGRELNRLRGELGLGRVRRVFDWWLSPQLILGFFPKWFGAPQPDWPRVLRQLSFPLFDGDPEAKISRELEEFLDAGDAPVAITFGTGVRHVGALYEAAIDACVQSKRRAVVITKYREQVRERLPQDLFAVEYVPFGRLFPRCAAVIHHGGVGTLASAIESRVPQLIVPFCYDQLDNAERVKKLGAGCFLPLRKANASRLTSALQHTLALKVQSQERARAEGGAFQQAAELIESFESRHRSAVPAL